MRLTVSLMLVALAASPTPSLAQSGLDTAKIEQIIGVKGAMIPDEHVFKVTKARNDVKVQVDGWSMPPFMGLGSWAAFTPSAHGGAMVMGDTVLFEDEVNPVMSAALESGLEVTALHNHFFFDQPRVYFLHIAGMGDEAKLASGVKSVWGKIAEIRAAQSHPCESLWRPKHCRRKCHHTGAARSHPGCARPGLPRHVQGRDRQTRINAGYCHRQRNGREHLGCLRGT